MFYERKVKYLDYLVKQEKCGNAGFIKLEARGEVCNIQFHISNLRPGDSGMLKAYFIADGQEKELCVLEVSGGKGMKMLSAQPLNNLGGTGISYDRLEAVRILICGERELYAKIGQAKENMKVQEVDREAADVLKETLEETTEADRTTETEEVTVVEKAAPTEEAEVTVPLLDTKWKQLWQLYPHIQPFQDQREYLSFTPGDFVIFPERYFGMANNSFLLHGYYNYKHLILKRMESRGGVKYYIGVPGNFYDREKQVAVMFGFESFESLEEPAGIGDYGYYMMRVEL